MRLFLDASVLLAAAGSSKGSSRALFSHATSQGWLLISTPYALSDVLGGTFYGLAVMLPYDFFVRERTTRRL